MIHFYHSFYGEYTKVHYINIVISIHLKISTSLWSVRFLLLRCPLIEGKPGFQGPEKLSLFLKQRCPFNRSNRYKNYVEVFLGPNFLSAEQRCPKTKVPLYYESDSINHISKVNANVHVHFLTIGYCQYCTNMN